MQCACYIAESDDKHPLRLNPCPEHERWAKAIREDEREACARVSEGYNVIEHGLDEVIPQCIASLIRSRGA